MQVNVTNAWGDGPSAIAMNAAGESVIVWFSQRTDGDPAVTSLQGRLYGADGAQRGDQFRIDNTAGENEAGPVVAISGSGEFVVAWVRYLGFDGSVVECQRFSAEGMPIGEQMLVNAHDNAWANRPAVAIDDEGNFVIVWDETPDLDQWIILARRFDVKARQLGDWFSVSAVLGVQENRVPAVAMTADGQRFVVAWNNRIPNDPNSPEIFARPFAGDGTPLGVFFRVNTLQSGAQTSAKVAVDAEGAFAIAWESESSNGSDQDGKSIQVRRFGSDGTPAGPEVQVNSYTVYDQTGADIAMAPDGNFVVQWYSPGSPIHGDKQPSLQLQRFLADGSLAGGPLEVNTTPGIGPQAGEVGLDADGAFVVAWSIFANGGPGLDLSNPIVRSRVTGWNQLFGDGFESGTLGSWSFTRP